LCCFLYKKLESIKQNKHRGKILQQAVEKTGLSIQTVAQKAGYKRGTYYLHIKKEGLSPAILNKYGKAIGYDFSEDVSEMEHFALEEPEVIYSIEPMTLEEAIKQRNEWKEKYYMLMEKYLRCIENEKK
jgi:transcriptional regulator with XRE-family HTH domain